MKITEDEKREFPADKFRRLSDREILQSGDMFYSLLNGPTETDNVGYPARAYGVNYFRPLPLKASVTFGPQSVRDFMRELARKMTGGNK